MNKGIFEKAFADNLNANFEKHAKYFGFKFYVLTDLGTIIFEVNKCLILKFDKAAITLTNHLLERALKLALIYNEAGVGPKPVENWTETFSGPSKKYNSINLGSSIEQCKKAGLLTQDEKDHLFDTIRVLMRNGFSHADPSEIVKNLPDKTPVFVGRFDKPSDIQKVNLDPKVIPAFQSLTMDGFARDFSFKYFDFVYGLLIRVDERLKCLE